MESIRGVARGTAEVPLSVLELATVGDGITPTEASARGDRPGQKGRAVGLPPHLGGRAPRHAGGGQLLPAVLIAHLAAATERIRVGSGGVMLPNHAPLVVAEQFGTLQALHPGRIDLGLGRAPGTDMATAHALRRSAEVRPRRVPAGRGRADRLPRRDVPAHPGDPARTGAPADLAARVERLLGQAGRAARAAVRVRPPLQRGQHRTGAGDLPHLLPPVGGPVGALRDARRLGAGRETEEEARRQALPGALSFLKLRFGTPGPFPTPEEAAAYEFSPMEAEFVRDRLSNVALGTPTRSGPTSTSCASAPTPTS